MAVTTGCQWIWLENTNRSFLRQEKPRVFPRCRCLCPALLLHCHGLILVLYFQRAPPFPAVSICQTRRASGWKKVFKWNWQILLTQSTTPLSRDRWQTSACRFLTKHVPLPRTLALTGVHHVMSINGCTLLFEVVTLINTGYLSVIMSSLEISSHSCL